MANVNIGDAKVADRNEILRVITGSIAVHGEPVEATRSDLDLTGIYVEDPNQVMGLQPTAEHWVTRTRPEGERSGPGDVDFTSYSLRKFIRLAVAGNPSILVPLYVKDPRHILYLHSLAAALRQEKARLLSQHAPRRFLGYLDSQTQRMQGVGKVSRMPKRPELVDAYGYDVKYASAALRLGMQGVELATTGTISLPMSQENREILIDMRTGGINFAEALAMIGDTRQQLVKAIEAPILPEEPDFQFINDWMTQAHLSFWRERGLV